MKKLLFFGSLALLGCTQTEAPKPIYPIPTPQQIEWQKMEQYAFVHFGLNTFNDLEWGYGDTPASTFDPVNLDAEQWVKTIQQAGLKGVILTVKHHDGFNLWQSKHTEYSVKNSPWRDGKGDMLKELIDACKKHDLKIGLYLSPWDRNHSDYGNPEYVKYFQAQISELINEYCDGIDLFEYWFDGANGGDGYYGGARESRSIDASSYYQYEEGVSTIHSKFPNAMIFGGTEPTIRWIGNEHGWAGETNWAMMNKDRNSSSAFHHGNKDDKDWLPGEVDVSIRPGWFYHAREDHQVRSLSNLVNIYYESVGRNANLLLNFPISLNGTIHQTDSTRVIEWWKTIQSELKTDLLKDAFVSASESRGGSFKADNLTDGSWDSYWSTSDSITTGDVTFTFDQPTDINRLLLQEYITLGQRVGRFSVDYFSDNSWKSIPTTDSMTTIGYKRIIRFSNITANKLRVSFTESRGPLAINNVEAFCAPALMVEPMISRNAKGIVTIKGGDTSSKIYYTTDGSTPTIKSALYTTPLDLKGKGVIKAIAQDASSADRTSPISTKSFDVLTSSFTVKGIDNGKAIFDSNRWSNFTFPKGKNDITIKTDKRYDIAGFTYIPDQSRGGYGVITSYELWANGKIVSSGEFSNIKANPIEQIIMLPKSVNTNKLRFVAKSVVAKTGRAVIAEFGVITK